MLQSRKFKYFIKTISVIVAGIFLCQQIAWAGDLTASPPPQTMSTQPTEQLPGTTPEDLIAQQTMQEDLISQKQAIEDFIGASTIPADSAPVSASALQEPTTSTLQIATEDGGTVRYNNDSVNYIEMSDGTVVDNLVLDDSNNIVNADVTNANGTSMIIRGG